MLFMVIERFKRTKRSSVIHMVVRYSALLEPVEARIKSVSIREEARG
jgi:hypothetical protein